MKCLLVFDAAEIPVQKKAVKKNVLQKCFAALLIFFVMQAAVAQTRVLIVAADLPGYTADVQAKLMATGSFSNVDIFDAHAGTPGLSLLQNYNAVFVWSDLPFADPIPLGNNLAAYIDGGGGVVTAVFATASIGIAGNFINDAYRVMVPAGQAEFPALTMGTVELPAHSLMNDVTGFDGGASSYRSTSALLTAGSYRVADWSDGSFLVTAKNNVGPKNVNRVDLGFFPPSADVRAGFWLTATGGTAIMKNALLYVAGDYVCTPPVAYSVSGGGTYCSNGDGLPIILNNSEVGVSYQLQLNAVDIGPPLNGGNGQLNFGNQANVGTYTIKATNIQNNNCVAMMQGSAAINTNPLPVADVVADEIICSGNIIPDIVFTNALPGTVFYWTTDNTSIGMFASGTNKVPAFTTVNNGSVPEIANITVRPAYTNNGITCFGPSMIFSITVTPLPTIICSANITVNNTAGQCGAIVNFPLPVATGFPAPIVTTFPASGSFFETGTTIVNVSANTCGTPSCSFTITVKDTEAPVITTSADITVNAPADKCGAIINYPTPLVTDNCGNTRTVNVTQSTTFNVEPGNAVSCNDGNYNFENSYYRIFDLGAMQLTGPLTIDKVRFGIESAAGNGGSQQVWIKLYTLTGNFDPANLTLVGSQQITVADQSGTLLATTLNSPVTLPANAKLVIELFIPDGETDQNFFLIGSNHAGQTGASYIAAPVCGVDVPVDIAAVGYPDMHIILDASGYISGALVPKLSAGLQSGSSFPVGSTIINYTASDTWGNTGEASFTITVKDVTPPVALAKNMTVQLDNSGTVTIAPGQIDNGSYDGCGISTITVSPNTFTCTSNSVNNVVLTVTDNYGNTSKANAVVTVIANKVNITTQLPAMVCLTDTAIALTAVPEGGTWAGHAVKNNYFDPAAAGAGAFTLTYTYINGSGCSTISYNNILVQDCAERHKALKDAVIIYPNPVRNSFFIKFLSDQYKDAGLGIYDAAGRKISAMRLTGLRYGQLLPVSVSTLPAGVYMLKVTSGNESAGFKIVVLN